MMAHLKDKFRLHNQPGKSQPEMTRDLRRYARDTNTRLMIGALLLLFIVGDGLIYIVYGPSAALLGFMCLIVGLLPILLIIVILSLIDWIARKSNEQ